MVPQQKSCTYNVTVCDNVSETKSESYSVCVPHTVTKQVPVKVCRKVAVEVPVENGSGCCNNGKSSRGNGSFLGHGCGRGCRKGC